MTPSIGVVVLNWNGWRDTRECLDSLAAARPGPARVVVVDNGSTDGSVAELKPGIEGDGGRWRKLNGELLLSATNLGFAGGSNLGLRHLQQDLSLSHFLLLNNDATVAEDYFAQLARALERVPDAGLLSGTVYHAGDPARTSYAGGRIVAWRGTVSHGRKVPTSPEPLATGFVSGAAMVVARGVLDTLGPLPECYHLYWEDAEYSVRAGSMGLRLVYAPRVTAYHRVSGAATSPRLRAQYLYAWHRNRGLFVRRNLTGWARRSALAYLVALKPCHALWRALTGSPREGWAMVRGTGAGLLGPLPSR